MNFAKWIHVKIQGWTGLATVLLPDQATVSDFKSMLGLEESFGHVNIAANVLPLASETVLYDCVDEFDTVFIEP